MGTGSNELRGLFPDVGPWARYVLAYPYGAKPAPAESLSTEADLLGRHRLAAKTLDVLKSAGAPIDTETVSAQ